jgi:hypothetical protein
VLPHEPHGHFLAITYAAPLLADEIIVKPPDVGPTLPAQKADLAVDVVDACPKI